MANADYDRGFLAGQESLDRDLDACKDKLEAAEAKLAEDAHRNDQLKRERDKYRVRLAEVEQGLDAALEQVEDERARVMKVEKERDAAEKGRDYYSAKNAERWASMAQARELAERMAEVWAHKTKIGARFDDIARLLSGDE